MAINSYWEDLWVELPKLPEGHLWKVALDTWDEPMKEGTIVGDGFMCKARSAVTLVCEP